MPHPESPDRPTAGVITLDARILVRVTGDDRASFFHGMCTADVKGARAGTILPALFLTEHAHVIADAFIWVTADALLLDLDADAWTRTRAHLEKLLVADDVEIEDAAELAVIDVEGPGRARRGRRAVARPVDLHRGRQFAHRQSAALRRPRRDGARCARVARFDHRRNSRERSRLRSASIHQSSKLSASKMASRALASIPPTKPSRSRRASIGRSRSTRDATLARKRSSGRPRAAV